MVLEVSNCCGFSLKNGTIIIGILQSIVAFMFLILSSAYAEHPHELLDMPDPSILPNLTVLKCILIIIAVASALQCIFSIMLIFGAVTNRPILLLPWLILNPTALIVSLVATFVAVIHHTGFGNTKFIVGYFIVSLAVTSQAWSVTGIMLIALQLVYDRCSRSRVIVSYKILVVHNFYRHLKSLNF